VTACNSTIDASTKTCPAGCDAARKTLDAEIVKKSGVCTVIPSGAGPGQNGTWLYDGAWRWSTKIDEALAKRGIFKNPCSYPEDKQCPKSYMMASDYSPAFGCEKKCSARCNQTVDAFFANCKVGDKHLMENALPDGSRVNQGQDTRDVFVALVNKCVDFMGKHPKTGKPFCEKKKMKSAICPLVGSLAMMNPAAICGQSLSLLVTLGALPPKTVAALIGAMMGGGGGGAVTALPPAMMAALTGVGPCISKLQLKGTIADFCPASEFKGGCPKTVAQKKADADKAAADNKKAAADASAKAKAAESAAAGTALACGAAAVTLIAQLL